MTLGAGNKDAQEAVRDALSRAADIDIGDLAEQIRRDRWTPPYEMIQLLMALVYVLRPHHIIEFGAGLSSRALIRAANTLGQSVYISSIDHDPVYGCEAFDRARTAAGPDVQFAGQIVPLVARPYYGVPMATYLIDRDRLACSQPFDLAIVDGPPAPLGGRAATLYQLIDMARPGAIVVFDDAARGDEQTYLRDWQDTLGPAVVAHGEAAHGRAALIEIRQPVSNESLWNHRLGLAAGTIAACVPQGQKLALIDDNQWDRQSIPNRPITPFHVARGEAAGPPANDEQAMNDLLRLQKSGVRYVAFGWPARWWRTTYPRLWQHLHQHATLLVDNANVTVFRLLSDTESGC
jgi:predicted O-methyltransferase YrrM